MSNEFRVFSAGSLTVLAVILIVALIIFVIPLLILGIIGAAFARLGFSWITALAVILLMLLGSGVNLPIYKIKRDTIRLSEINSNVFDIGEQSGSHAWETIVSLNLGGAIFPLAISTYLIYRAGMIVGSQLVISVCAGVIAVSVITFVATRSFPRVGLRVPLLMPALTALLVSILLNGGVGLTAAVPAFVSGVVGTLLGGNIAHLLKVRDLDIDEISIGGGGTFAAIFICCILPTLIA
jgi:uncharacterized membrane protein